MRSRSVSLRLTGITVSLLGWCSVLADCGGHRSDLLNLGLTIDATWCLAVSGGLLGSGIAAVASGRSWGPGLLDHRGLSLLLLLTRVLVARSRGGGGSLLPGISHGDAVLVVPLDLEPLFTERVDIGAKLFVFLGSSCNAFDKVDCFGIKFNPFIFKDSLKLSKFGSLDFDLIGDGIFTILTEIS